MPTLFGRDIARAQHVDLSGMMLRQMIPLVIVGFAFWAMRDTFSGIDTAEIGAAAATVSIYQWGAAALATGASFWAIGRYDAVLHGVLGTGIAPKTARTSGGVAIAIGQFTGFGVITGALARWRLVHDLTLWQSLRLSAAVSLSFLAGWAIITALAVLFMANTGTFSDRLATAVLAAAAVLAVFSLWQPGVLGQLPSLRAMAAILGLVAVDTFCAGIAFWVLLPLGTDLSLLQLLPVFLLATGAGIIGGTPAGIGPFEITLITLMPHHPSETLLAAALAFRLVYFVMPATIATAYLIRGSLRHRADLCETALRRVRAPYLPVQDEQRLWQAPRAEHNLVRQMEFGWIEHKGFAIGIAAPSGQSLIMLADPLDRTPAPQRICALLKTCARAHHLNPVIYKCGARLAHAARASGWKVLPVAQETWLAPAKFDLQGSSYRQLRRMLRKASDAGLRIHNGARDLPLDDMQRVSDAWSRDRGGERGFSMGRFDRDYIQAQRVFLAMLNGRLVGFLTCHETAGEWTVDLMRQAGDAPPGTMHMLLHHAIRNGAAEGCPRLSLAALPIPGRAGHSVVERLRGLVADRCGGDGLGRFKRSFAPEVETLYLAAPGWISLGLGCWDVIRRIRRHQR